MLIVLKGVADCRTAMLVDRVSEIPVRSESALLPVAAKIRSTDAPRWGIRQRSGRPPAVYAHVLLRREREALNGAAGGSAAALAELGDREPVSSTQASDELNLGSAVSRLKQHVLGSTGLAYYEDKDHRTREPLSAAV